MHDEDALEEIRRWAETHGEISPEITKYLATIETRTQEELQAFSDIVLSEFLGHLDEDWYPSANGVALEHLLSYVSQLIGIRDLVDWVDRTRRTSLTLHADVSWSIEEFRKLSAELEFDRAQLHPPLGTHDPVRAAWQPFSTAHRSIVNRRFSVSNDLPCILDVSPTFSTFDLGIVRTKKRNAVGTMAARLRWIWCELALTDDDQVTIHRDVFGGNLEQARLMWDAIERSLQDEPRYSLESGIRGK